MEYLLLFTIGPVQALINHSRKGKDLYAGSKLLSELMGKAIRYLREDARDEETDVRIIIPAYERDEACSGGPGSEPDRLDLPNRLIAGITTAGPAGAAKLTSRLEALEEWIKKEFLEKCRALLRGAGIDGKGWRLAERQLRNYLEVYWLLEPYDNRPYKEVYGSLFRRSQEIKGIRRFEQAEEPWNRKCMLFPEYNAVFVKKKQGGGNPANVNPKDICDITENSDLRYKVKPGEALSAIALVKRLYLNPDTICSLRQMLLKSREDNLPVQGPGKGDMLANAVYDIINDNAPEEEYEEGIREMAANVCDGLKQNGTRLSSYYAMVKLDGDGMGDVFLDKDTPQEHRELSGSIGRFARRVPDILNRNGGIPVYAGGEDFLGFLPLDKLFPCLEELRRAYRKEIGLTFSAGVVVAHLMQPLKEVAAASEEMEGLAKLAEGKNSCVAGIFKRGGEQVVTPPLCFDGAQGRPGIEDWRLLTEELGRSGCSKSLLYHLGDLFRRFLEEGAEPDAGMARVLVREAAAASAAREPDEITQAIMAFYGNSGGLAGFLNILNASSFIAREVKECIT